MLLYRGLLKFRGELVKPGRSKLKLANAGCLGLSPVISAQFSLKMCIEAENREKFTKYYNCGDLRSFKVIDVSTPEKLVMTKCQSAPATVFFTLNESIAVKITNFAKSVLLFDALHKILSPKTGVLWLSEDFMILACTVLIVFKGAMDERTDR